MFIVFLCTSALLLFPRGERWTFTVSGDRWVCNAFNRVLHSYVSGASSMRRLSVAMDILLNYEMSMAFLR